MRRTKQVRQAAIVGVALSLTLGACGGRDEAPPADGTARIDVSTSVPSITTAGALAMDAQGIGASHGLDIQFDMAGASSTLSVEAVLSGDADLALAGPASILAAMREGAPLTILGSTSNNLQVMLMRPDVVDRLGVSPDAPVEERVQALRGLTIGTNPVGSTYQILLRQELASFGLDPDEDVRLIGVQDANALVTGIGQSQFDAIATSSGIVEQATVNSGAEVWLSGPRGDVEATSELPVVVMVGRTDWVDENTETVDKFRDAMNESLETLRTDRDTLGPILQEKYFSAMDPGVWDLAWAESAGGIPESTVFPRSSFDFWVENDPEGVAAYDDVVYENVVYGAAQG
ncbi:ABC transporter substrate-binding protein [Rhodococcoides fascians]|uniref:ABC transporter substrate-binding protein n=1 Tax=Rhodococcoides fascians TaxID=1828 RepID=UPI00056C0144|nr:ABC transporter substrate-binding protein [Rhodococcus fascians]